MSRTSRRNTIPSQRRVEPHGERKNSRCAVRRGGAAWRKFTSSGVRVVARDLPQTAEVLRQRGLVGRRCPSVSGRKRCHRTSTRFALSIASIDPVGQERASPRRGPERIADGGRGREREAEHVQVFHPRPLCDADRRATGRPAFDPDRSRDRAAGRSRCSRSGSAASNGRRAARSIAPSRIVRRGARGRRPAWPRTSSRWAAGGACARDEGGRRRRVEG